MNRFGVSFADNFFQIVDQPFGLFEAVLFLAGFVFKRNLDTFVQITDHLETLFDHLGIEFDLGEDRGVRMEVDLCAAAACRPDFFEAADRLALLEPHLPFGPVAANGGDQFLGQGVDHARADAMQTAGSLVTAVFELAARMQNGEDHFKRAFLAGRMFINRNAAAIVFDRQRRSIGMKCHPNV